MISASEINKKVDKAKRVKERAKISEEQKIKNDRINSELLEVEKAINTFFRKIDLPNIDLDKCKYIKVDTILSNDVEQILKTEGYFIDNLYKNETRLYFDEITFLEVLAQHESHRHDIGCTTNTTIDNNDNTKSGYIDSIAKSMETSYDSSKIRLYNSNLSKIENEDWGYRLSTEVEKLSKMSILCNEKLWRLRIRYELNNIGMQEVYNYGDMVRPNQYFIKDDNYCVYYCHSDENKRVIDKILKNIDFNH